MILLRAKVRIFLTLLAVLGILSSIYEVSLALADFSSADLELKTGTLTTNGTIQAMALGADGTLYIGGSFTAVSGTTRNNLAAIGTDGALTSWDPNANAVVYTLAISGSTVYIGGDFTAVSGTTRNRLAAVGITDGALTSWDPNVNKKVLALAISGTTVYVGGSFATASGTTRNRLAAVGITDGALTSWNPNVNGSPLQGTVHALAISGTTIYVGGEFTSVSSTTRNRLAAVGITDGALTSWNPNTNNTVETLAISGSTIYTSGSFTAVSGTTRNNLAAVGITDGALTSWNPNASGTSAGPLVISGSTIYFGGSFTAVSGTTRNNLAAIGTDGTLTSWDPNANSTVNALAISGTTVYVGGQFTAMNGNSNIIRLAQFIVPQKGGGRAAGIARIAGTSLPPTTTFFPPPVNPDLTSATSTATSTTTAPIAATSTTATSTSSTTSLGTLSVLPPYPTTAQIQTAISELTKQVNQIQDNLQAPDVLTLIAQIAQQIARIQQVIGVPPATPPPAGAMPKAGSYQKPFFLKQRNNDVRALQTFLKSQGADIYPEGLVTGYFGPLTKEAVGRFQLKYDLVHDKDGPVYGYLGPKTRAKINSLLSL